VKDDGFAWRQGNVDLDAETVERTRSELGAGSESDAAVVERALNAYLLERLLDVTQAKAGAVRRGRGTSYLRRAARGAP